ncbi:phospholipid/cholesterol/gamma-HCH transport system substrate-binding protein [Flavobacteriaceae bacterium MAR_2010_188]|nr:phospholipid/cholesterol/gamma-HCH transport system substrate-binding protein [Flavobacteriaceae bacterium MAR_2010_188]
MKISKEVKAAILVLSGILLFIYLFNYLKGDNLLNSSRVYYALYNNVEGLSSSTPVTVNGLNVGQVRKITFDEDGSGRLKVEMLIENNFEFSKNSKAELYEAGLIGGKAIAIIPANDGAEKAKSGQMLDSDIKAGLSELVNRRLTPLQEKMESVMGSADSLLNNVNTIFDEETKTNLKDAVAELSATITAYKSTSQALNGLIASNQEKLSATLTNFETASSNLANITGSISDADLASAVNDLKDVITKFDGIAQGIDDGQGSLGKLLKDEGLYQNLDGATKQLEALLQDFKLNPKRYFHFSVFGKKPKQYDAEGNLIEDKEFLELVDEQK